MADETAALKQLQAGLNHAFETIFSTDSKDTVALAAAKEQLIGLSHATAGVAMGPAFSVIALSMAPVNYMAVRIAIDLNLFSIIASNPQPTSLGDIVTKTEASPDLITRIIRLINAIGFTKQLSPTTWTSTPLTHAMTLPPLRDWAIAHFDKRMEVYGRFPAWLKARKWKTTWSDEDNVCRDVHDGLDIWSFYAENPEASAIFDSAMSIQDSWPAEMTPAYPFFEEDASTLKPDGVTLVDIGGGKGQALAALRERYPNIPGDFILQDLPKTVSSLPASVPFTAMSHDFFTPQPIHGAKYYHLRRVLHDWNDDRCLAILAATRSAMEPGYSRLLIHEFVIPDVGAGPTEPVIDLVMMTSCDGKERTEAGWRELLGKAGFRMEGIYRAEMGTTAVIEAGVVA